MDYQQHHHQSNGGLMNGQSQHETAPSFLFGDRINKRKAMALSGRPSGFGSPGILKKDLQFSSPGAKNVRWSSDLVQEQLFSSKPTTTISSPSGDMGSSGPSKLMFGSANISTPYYKGPPLSSLDTAEFEPPQKLQRPDSRLDHKESALSAINSNLNAFNTSINNAEFWVTVFGFPAEDRDMILELFSRHGNVVSHNIPRLGNWVHIRYSSVLHAQQALGRNGNIIADRLMLGVVKCTDQEVISDSKTNPLNVSASNKFGEVSFGNPVMQSTFKNAHDQDPLNGSRASVTYGDAASFNRSRLSVLSRNGMRSLRASEADVALDTSNQKDGSFLSKIWNFVAPQ